MGPIQQSCQKYDELSQKQYQSYLWSLFEQFKIAQTPVKQQRDKSHDAVRKGMLAKWLHQPSVRLREQAGTLRGDRLAEALHDLFDLP